MKTLLAALLALAACAGRSSDASADPDPNAPHPYRTAKPSQADLKKELTPLQFEVTQHEGTEPPFHNAYFDNHAAGLYVDITTGQPLFSSLDKYDSGTGWPSFTRPIAPSAIATRTDADGDRTEVRSAIGDAHLGHVFDDGPKPTGLRYCMNSASLRFIPADKLDGVYAPYRALFAAKPSK